MIKKLFFIVLIIWGLFAFYKKFIAPTLEPFFEKYRGKVDFFGMSIPEERISPEE